MFTPQATITVMDRPTGSTSIVVLPSRLDVHTVDELAARVERTLRTDAGQLIIDARQVRHADLAGLEFVQGLCRDLEASGVSYLVEDMSLTVRIALELNGFQTELDQLDRHLVELAVA